MCKEEIVHGDIVTKIVLPKLGAHMSLQLAHDVGTAGHFGHHKTYERLSRNLVWSRLWRDGRDYINTCSGCQKVTRQTDPKSHSNLFLSSHSHSKN